MEISVYNSKGKPIAFSKNADMHEEETALQRILIDYRTRCDNMLTRNLMQWECDDAKDMGRKAPTDFTELKKYMEDNHHELVILPGWIKQPVYKGANKDNPDLCDFEGGIDLSRIGIVENGVCTLFSKDVMTVEQLKEYAIR